MVSYNEPPSKSGPPAANDALPPVEAPSSAFILQLFLIPMIIVTVIVSVWLGFSWLAHMGSDPRKLVTDIRKMNTASWQKALILANMLRSPEHKDLKKDARLAQELADLLKIKLAAASADEQDVQLRYYLCRTLGEFETLAGLEALLLAAEQQKHPTEILVRQAAVSALAVLISNVGAEKLQDNVPLLDALTKASRARSDAPDEIASRAALRSTAAFTLGVLGGKPARDRLAQMLTDSQPNVRYNAATGLARQGDGRSSETLVEMMDPENQDAIREEPSETAKIRKRMAVISNAVRAAAQLVQKSPDTDMTPVLQAIDRLLQDPTLHRAVKTHAREAKAVIEDVLERASAASGSKD